MGCRMGGGGSECILNVLNIVVVDGVKINQFSYKLLISDYRKIKKPIVLFQTFSKEILHAQFKKGMGRSGTVYSLHNGLKYLYNIILLKNIL